MALIDDINTVRQLALTNESIPEKLKSLIIWCPILIAMSDVRYSKSDLAGSISELESLGLETPKLNELNDSYEVENLVENIKQSYFQDYKSLPVYSD